MHFQINQTPAQPQLDLAKPTWVGREFSGEEGALQHILRHARNPQNLWRFIKSNTSSLQHLLAGGMVASKICIKLTPSISATVDHTMPVFQILFFIKNSTNKCVWVFLLGALWLVRLDLCLGNAMRCCLGLVFSIFQLFFQDDIEMETPNINDRERDIDLHNLSSSVPVKCSVKWMGKEGNGACLLGYNH